MPGRLSLKSRLFSAAVIIAGAGLFLSACAVQSTHPDAPPRIVTLRGTVFDSLTFAPLRGARVTLTAGDTVTATTDTNGTFEVSLRSGIWRAEIAHPRFDSLRIAAPARRLEVPPKALVAETLSTPSRRTVTRMLCGDSTRNDDVALVGVVRDAATQRGLDSAFAIVKWINLTLWRGAFVKSVETRLSPTTRGGWYVTCGVPGNGTLLSWAEHFGATSGAVPVALEGAPTRLDLSVDATALPFGGSIDLDLDPTGASLFPIARGSARYRVIVRDPRGRPISNARVRILGRNTERTNDVGAATLDSIAGGTQTIEIVALGYQPQRRTVDIAPNRVPTDTVVLASLGTVLDPVRIVAGRDASGFEHRRSVGTGQFITAADVERENPARTTGLLRTRDGLRLTYDKRGYAYIEVTTQTRNCSPLVFVDGSPAPPVPMVPGEAAMDWLIHPDEIGGVEIYTSSAKIPPEFSRWKQSCGIVLFWTRQALGLPKSGMRPP